MRASDPPVHDLVGTPKGRLTKLEKSFLTKPWATVRDQVTVKLLEQDGELYVLALSAGRQDKERAMRQRRLKRLWQRLHELQRQTLSRDDLLLKLGAAKKDAGRADGLVRIQVSIRPIYHQLETRIEAPIFVAFLAYCLQVTLKARLRPLAPGLTPRSALEQFAAIQMVDVHLPTTDGRTLVLSRYTEPQPDQQLLLVACICNCPRNRHRGSPPPWKPASTKRLVVPTLAHVVTAKQRVT